jgi:energy-coupling factor transporter ATP-binding protein EcfA2
MRQNLLDQLIDYFDSRFEKRPEYAKGLALGVISTIAANSCRTHISAPGQHRSNLFIVILGVSGSGKSSIIKYASELLEAIKYENIITDDLPPESYVRVLGTKHHALMMIGEMSRFLGSYKKKSYMAGSRETMIQAYDGTPLTQIRSGGTTDARNYALTAIGDTQPIAIKDTADETDVASGFLPRFMYFFQSDAPDVFPKVLTPEQIIIRDNLIERLSDSYQIATHNNLYFVFTQEQVSLMYDKMKFRRGQIPPAFEPFYIRIIDFVYKIAMLHMFASDTILEKMKPSDADDWTKKYLPDGAAHDVEVRMENADVDWALELVQDYVDRLLPQVLEVLNLNDGAKVREIVREYEKTNNVKSIPESYVYRRLGSTMKDLWRMKAAVEMAIKMEYVYAHSHTSGRSLSSAHTKTTSVDDFSKPDSNGKKIIVHEEIKENGHDDDDDDEGDAVIDDNN